MRRLFRDPLLLLGGLFLFGLLLFAIFVPTIRTAQLQPKGEANFDAVTSMLERGTYLLPGQKGATLGTDELGRDVLARLAQGARVSLVVGVVVQVFALVIGMLFGVLGGALVDRWERRRTMWVTDAARAVLLAIPAAAASEGSA